MNIKKMTACSVTLIALAAASVAPALATPVTFAQFAVQAMASPFKYTNTGATSGFTLIGGSVPVSFNYEGNNGYNHSTNTIAATLHFTALVDGKVSKTVIPSFGTLDTEHFKNVSISFTANTAVGGHTNLLTLLPTATGAGGGYEGSQNLTLIGDTTKPVSPDVVTFTSDFLDFSHVTSTSYALSFTSVVPSLFDRTTNSGAQKKDYFRTFTTSGNGSFSSDPYPFGAVPEPAPVAAFLIGGMGLALLAFRGRKAARLMA